MITRRHVPALLFARGASLAAVTGASAAETAPKELRIGYQKIGLIVSASTASASCGSRSGSGLRARPVGGTSRTSDA